MCAVSAPVELQLAQAEVLFRLYDGVIEDDHLMHAPKCLILGNMRLTLVCMRLQYQQKPGGPGAVHDLHVYCGHLKP